MKWSSKIINKLEMVKKDTKKKPSKAPLKKKITEIAFVGRKERNKGGRVISPVAASKISRSKTDALP